MTKKELLSITSLREQSDWLVIGRPITRGNIKTIYKN